jgi:predicted SAM-dependent methyltransferase
VICSTAADVGVSLKLHLGCGEKHIDGYINIDIRYMPGVDKVDDVKFLRSFAENSVDVIYCCALLEHFSRWEYMLVLKRWYDLLKPGGVLRLSVPDFRALSEHYLEHGDLRQLIGMLYGRQDYPENFHHMCWDRKTLEEDLASVGFEVIYEYDWRLTEHSDLDDYSQSYLPHMDKQNGKLMHLNLEAIK